MIRERKEAASDITNKEDVLHAATWDPEDARQQP
jgi:hypothetical protein